MVCTGCPEKPGGSDRPMKRKLNKSNVKSKPPALHFQGDSEKTRWKGTFQTTQFLQNEKRKMRWFACLCTTEPSFSAELSHPTTYYCLWCWGALLFLLMLKAAFHWGRDKDGSEWECAAKMRLLSPISHHCKHHINLWTNQQEGREMLCDGSSFNSTLLLSASWHH